MLEMLVKGGPVMIFIGLCAVIATVIIIERFLYYASVRKEYGSLIPALNDLLRKGKYGEAEMLCDRSASPLAKLTRAGLEYSDRGERALKEAVNHASTREIPKIERYVAALGTIANISTLLGLLGTVTGNIKAFGVLAATGAMGNPALLAGAIAEALITTAAGLIISIPATVFYNYFVSRANHLISDTESAMGDLVILLTGKEDNHAV